MRLLVFQHVEHEPPAAFADLARAAGDTLHVVRFYLGEGIPDLEGFDALLVMGGPMDVWQVDENPWLANEIAAIATWVGAGRPYLGICLGHQLLATAMDGECAAMATPEIGIAPVERQQEDPLLAALPRRFGAMQWHGVEVTRPPEGTAILAANSQCAVQAMRIGTCAWGVQFHPEITPGLVTGWMRDPANWRCAVDWLGAEDLARDFGAAAEAHVPDALSQSAAFYGVLRDCARRNT